MGLTPSIQLSKIYFNDTSVLFAAIIVNLTKGQKGDDTMNNSFTLSNEIEIPQVGY